MAIVSFKMKKMSKSIKKCLASNVLMSKSTDEGQDSQSYQKPIARTRDENTIYYHLK